MKQHKEEDPRYFECHICKFQTFIKTELELHVKSLHMVHQKDAPKKEIKVEQTGGVEDIRCDLCFFKTKSPTGIKIHCKRMHAVTSVNKFKCDQCDANLRTPQLLQMHQNKVHGCFDCDICDFKTNSESDFRNHMTVQHIKDQFQSILKVSNKRRASEMCHVSPEKERKLKRVTFKGVNPDPAVNTSKEFKEMEQTLIAAMQTIETLEGQNSELHAKIDHIGHLAMFLEDLKEENSKLKTCEHCKFEFKTVKSFREHMCNRQIPQNIHCVIEIDNTSEFQSPSKSLPDIAPHSSPPQEEALNITYKCKECSFQGRSEEEIKQHKRDEKSAYRAKSPAYLQDKSNKEMPTPNSERADLLILASGKSNGHTRAGPQNEPVQKIVQVHCALDLRGPLECTFQCNSKEELERHITKKHTLTCTVCPVQLNNLNDLAAHMNSLHKKSEDIICNICEMKVQTKSELIDHIKIHKSYKLCKNYAMNNCGPQIECRYQHTILPPGLHICYKCGVTSPSKTDIMKHIKSKHGNEICHNFLRNRCEYQRCMFSHNNPHALNVESVPEREMVTPSAPREADFVDLPTIGPVVRIEERAQPQTPQEEVLSPQQQEEMRQATVRLVTMHMEQMIPQIIAQISEAMTKKTFTPKKKV